MDQALSQTKIGKGRIFMAYDDRASLSSLPHRVLLDGREHLSVTGVEDVESFDESTVVLQTAGGLLILRGSALHIDKLSIEGGELSVTGRLDSLVYEDGSGGREGFFSRLFR